MHRSTLTIALVAFFVWTASGQLVTMAAFPVVRSALTEQIKALRAANPRMTTTDWAKAADVILQKDGINTMISFDAATCENIKKARDARKDPKSPIRLNATLRSVDAEKAALALPEPQFMSDDCGGCYIELPILQLTESDFVTRVRDQNIRFALPANFIVNQIQLVDVKNTTSIRKTFRVPFRAIPIGVTYDENAVYLGFPDPDLRDLALLAFDEGTFEIVTRKEAEEGGLGTLINEQTGSVTKLIRFERWRKSYLFRFQPPCDK